MPWVDIRLPRKGVWGAERRGDPGRHLHLRGRQRRDQERLESKPNWLRGKHGEVERQKKGRRKC